MRRINSLLVKEIRGKGLMIGIELTPEAGLARQFCEQLMELGMLCKDSHNHTIRIAPPLVISKEEVEWALERLESALRPKQI